MPPYFRDFEGFDDEAKKVSGETTLESPAASYLKNQTQQDDYQPGDDLRPGTTQKPSKQKTGYFRDFEGFGDEGGGAEAPFGTFQYYQPPTGPIDQKKTLWGKFLTSILPATTIARGLVEGTSEFIDRMTKAGATINRYGRAVGAEGWSEVIPSEVSDPAAIEEMKQRIKIENRNQFINLVTSLQEKEKKYGVNAVSKFIAEEFGRFLPGIATFVVGKYGVELLAGIEEGREKGYDPIGQIAEGAEDQALNWGLAYILGLWGRYAQKENLGRIFRGVGGGGIFAGQAAVQYPLDVPYDEWTAEGWGRAVTRGFATGFMYQQWPFQWKGPDRERAVRGLYFGRKEKGKPAEEILSTPPEEISEAQQEMEANGWSMERVVNQRGLPKPGQNLRTTITDPNKAKFVVNATVEYKISDAKGKKISQSIQVEVDGNIYGDNRTTSFPNREVLIEKIREQYPHLKNADIVLEGGKPGKDRMPGIPYMIPEIGPDGTPALDSSGNPVLKADKNHRIINGILCRGANINASTREEFFRPDASGRYNHWVAVPSKPGVTSKITPPWWETKGVSPEQVSRGEEWVGLRDLPEKIQQDFINRVKAGAGRIPPLDLQTSRGTAAAPPTAVGMPGTPPPVPAPGYTPPKATAKPGAPGKRKEARIELDSIVNGYLDTIKNAETKSKYQGNLRRFKEYIVNNFGVDPNGEWWKGLNRNHFEAYMAEQERFLSGTSLKSHRDAVTNLYNHIIALYGPASGIENIAAGGWKVTTKPETRAPISEEQIKTFINAAKNEGINKYVIVLSQVEIGARPGDVATLKVESYVPGTEITAPSLVVKRVKERGGIKIDKIPISEELGSAIDQMLTERYGAKENWVKGDSLFGIPKELFLRADPKPARAWVTNIIGDISQRAIGTRITSQHLRTEVASRYAEKFGVGAASKLLGNLPGTARQYYVKIRNMFYGNQIPESKRQWEPELKGRIGVLDKDTKAIHELSTRPYSQFIGFDAVPNLAGRIYAAIDYIRTMSGYGVPDINNVMGLAFSKARAEGMPIDRGAEALTLVTAVNPVSSGYGFFAPEKFIKTGSGSADSFGRFLVLPIEVGEAAGLKRVRVRVLSPDIKGKTKQSIQASVGEKLDLIKWDVETVKGKKYKTYTVDELDRNPAVYRNAGEGINFEQFRKQHPELEPSTLSENARLVMSRWGKILTQDPRLKTTHAYYDFFDPTTKSSRITSDLELAAWIYKHRPLLEHNMGLTEGIDTPRTEPLFPEVPSKVVRGKQEKPYITDPITGKPYYEKDLPAGVRYVDSPDLPAYTIDKPGGGHDVVFISKEDGGVEGALRKVHAKLRVSNNKPGQPGDAAHLAEDVNGPGRKPAVTLNPPEVPEGTPPSGKVSDFLGGQQAWELAVRISEKVVGAAREEAKDLAKTLDFKTEFADRHPLLAVAYRNLYPAAKALDPTGSGRRASTVVRPIIGQVDRFFGMIEKVMDKNAPVVERLMRNKQNVIDFLQLADYKPGTKEYNDALNSLKPSKKLLQVIDLLHTANKWVVARVEQWKDPSHMFIPREYWAPLIFKYFPESAKRALAKTDLEIPRLYDRGWMQQRMWKDIKTAVEHGAILATYNPIELYTLRWAAMLKYATVQEASRMLLNTDDARMIRPGDRPPDGFYTVSNFSNIAFRPGAAQLMANFLSPTLWTSHYVGGAYSAVQRMNHRLNLFQLGLGSFFHVSFTGLESQVSTLSEALQSFSYMVSSEGKGRRMKELGKGSWALLRAITPLSTLMKLYYGHKLLNENYQGGLGRVGKKIGEYAAKDVKSIQAIVSLVEASGGGFAGGFRHGWMVPKYYERTRAAILSRNPKEFAKNFLYVPAEMTTRAIMDHWVPLLKAGTFREMMTNWLDRNPRPEGSSNSESVLKWENRAIEESGKIWNHVDARLGAVRYDRLFIRNATKNLAQLFVRAPGWKAGTVTEILGAPVELRQWGKQWYQSKSALPPPLPRRVCYTIALLGMAGMLNSLLSYIYTTYDGKEYEFDWKDIWSFRTGAKDEQGRDVRFVLPLYTKDIYSFYRDPIHWAASSTSPMVNYFTELFRNKTFYGEEIHRKGTKDEPFRKFTDIGKYTIKAFEPFWYRASKRLERREAPLSAHIAAATGFMPASPVYTMTDGERIATEMFMRKQSAGPTTIESRDRREIHRKIVWLLRSGRREEAMALSREHGFNYPAMRARIEKQSRHPYIYQMFDRLEDDEAARVWDELTPKEKIVVRRQFLHKLRKPGAKLPKEARDYYIKDAASVPTR